MIIGRYAIAPSDVLSGSLRFDPECLAYEVTIILAGEDCETVLTQWEPQKKLADRMLKQINRAIEEGAEERLELAKGEASE